MFHRKKNRVVPYTTLVKQDIDSLLATGKRAINDTASRAVMGCICLPACITCISWSIVWRLLCCPMTCSITDNKCTFGSDECVAAVYKTICSSTNVYYAHKVDKLAVVKYAYTQMAPLYYGVQASTQTTMPNMIALHKYLSDNEFVELKELSRAENFNAGCTLDEFMDIVGKRLMPPASVSA
ncbi:hypothetical protein PLESTM_001050900 [Pleodorina starrii]|nr:hypothetical protein PLESTM_001050900 [Pleodorina starrii]